MFTLRRYPFATAGDEHTWLPKGRAPARLIDVTRLSSDGRASHDCGARSSIPSVPQEAACESRWVSR